MGGQQNFKKINIQRKYTKHKWNYVYKNKIFFPFNANRFPFTSVANMDHKVKNRYVLAKII